MSWDLDDFGEPDYLDGIKAQFMVCSGAESRKPVAYCFKEADGRLIAAAPDLLALAEIFLGGDERYQVAVGGNPIAVDKMLAAARSVVANAKGVPSGESSP